MSLDIDAMIAHHERLREERASDAIAQLAPTPELTPLADHARDNTVTQLLHHIARLEGIDYDTARLKHLGDK